MGKKEARGDLIQDFLGREKHFGLLIRKSD
jgi:hypothetical protein